MAVGIAELYGDEEQVFQRLMRNISFNIHVAVPAVVQSFNAEKQTVEVQPTIRERFVGYDGQINFINYPLLINVPVVYPQAGGFRITFPIEQGDECLVVFSDTPIDNWWKYGNVQNPIEQRRHDLSDGFAIFGVMNQEKLSEQSEPYTDGIAVESQSGTGIRIDDGEIYFQGDAGKVTLSSIINHIHVDSMGGPTQPSHNIKV